MITEIPKSEDYNQSAIQFLYLAWEIIIKTIEDLDDCDGFFENLDIDDYWKKSQPMLVNAYGLIQQSMEMALKGRIASISPYLLISRNPRDWPSSAEHEAVPFSEFRTIDSADLIKVFNSFSPQPFSKEFKEFFHEVRRNRNVIMHSLPRSDFHPADIVKNVIQAAVYLFPDQTWPEHCLALQNIDRF